MSYYISIDGDDIGHKIARCYLENSEDALTQIHRELDEIVIQICNFLKNAKLQIIFCAADGIVCKGRQLDTEQFVKYMASVGKPSYTFSAGIGIDLQTSYFALKYAKAMGKDKVVIWENKSFSILNFPT